MKTILLVMVWILTLAAGVGLGYLWRDAAPEMAVENIASPVVSLPIDNTAPQVAAADASSQTKELIARLEQENAAMGQTIFQLTLKQIISSANQSPGEGYFEQRWKEYRKRAEYSRGLGNLDNMLNMMMELARYSEEGVRFLDGVAYDTRRPDAERETALQMMAQLPHPDAFNSLIEFRDDSIMELEYPYDLVMRHVANLDTADIAPRIPDMLAQIQYELGVDNFSPERPLVLFYLADKHGSREAEQLLFDERMSRENVQDILHAAQSSHSDLGLNVVEGIAQYHIDDSVRRNADRILDRW